MPDLGKPIFDTSRCVDPQVKLQAVYENLEDAGFPYPGDTYQYVYFDVINNTIVNQDGDDIGIAGTTYTAEVPLYIGASIANEISLQIGTGLAVSGGALIATGSPSVTLLEGNAIDITGGDTLNVDIATEKGLEFVTEATVQKLAVWLVSSGGLEFRNEGDAEDGALQDKWRYHLVKGTAKGALYIPSNGSVEIDNVVATHGETPVAMSSDVLTCAGLPLYCADNDVLYAKFDNFGAVGLSDSWTTDTMLNLRPVLAGFEDYAPASNLLFGHRSGDTLSGQQTMNWDTTTNWLKLISGYTGSGIEVLVSSSGTIEWKTLAAALNLLAGYASGSDQVIQHEATAATSWQNTEDC